MYEEENIRREPDPKWRCITEVEEQPPIGRLGGGPRHDLV